MRLYQCMIVICAVWAIGFLGGLNEVLAGVPGVGDPAAGFELQDAQGKTHKLSDYKGTVVVVHFQSCRCPWDVAYQPMLNELARRFLSGQSPADEGQKAVQFLGINSNRMEDMAEIAAYIPKSGLGYPVLKDPGNVIADAYGAKTTPHMYVINADAQQTLAYVGGLEKAPLSPAGVGKSDEQYLGPVLEALVHGQAPPTTESRSIGCSIKRERH